MFIQIMIANFLVGISVGICGIAGFLLPLFYSGILNLKIVDSMAMSFCAFSISGLLGAYSYKKTSDLDLKFAYKIAIGSIIGSGFGVWFNNSVPVLTAKIFLYLMVLGSGLSVLLKKKDGTKNSKLYNLKNNSFFIIFIGIFIAIVSSFTGAGGPVLSVPLLLLLGFSVRKSVGISLFNSIFIAIPAFVGYYFNSTIDNIEILILICIISHGIGALLGVKISDKINQEILKKIVSIGSIVISLYMIVKIL